MSNNETLEYSTFGEIVGRVAGLAKDRYDEPVTDDPKTDGLGVAGFCNVTHNMEVGNTVSDDDVITFYENIRSSEYTIGEESLEKMAEDVLEKMGDDAPQ
ncbi:MAG: hypothetical protein ABEJ03_00055 [Candidatus Nanohaloarchaea archaeon]